MSILKKLFSKDEPQVLQNYKEFKGHEKRISTVGVFKGKLYSGCLDCTIRQWEPDSGLCMAVLRGHHGQITSMVISNDGVLYSGSHDADIRSWSAERQCMLKVFKGHTKTISSLCLRDDILYSGGFDFEIRKWDVSTGNCISVFQGHTDTITGISVQDDILYSSSADGTLRKWSVKDGQCLIVFKGHTGWVWDFALTKKNLFSASMDSTLRKWNTDTGTCEKVYSDHSECVCRVSSLDANNSIITSSWDGTLKEFDLDTDKCLRTLKGHKGQVKFLISRGHNVISAAENDVRIWYLKGKNVTCLYVLNNNKQITTVSVNGDSIYVGSKDGTIRKWTVPKTNSTQSLFDTTNELETHFSGVNSV